MKKITLLMTVFAMSILSCQKEKLNPQDPSPVGNNSSSIKQTFRYSETIAILDESGKYSVDFLIQCNDKKVFDQEIHNLKGQKMTLLYEHPKTSKNNSSVQNNLKKPENNILQNDDNNALYTTIKNVKKGNAKGFFLESKFKNKSSDSFDGTIWLSTNRYYFFPATQSYFLVEWIVGCDVYVNYYLYYHYPDPNYGYEGYLAGNINQSNPAMSSSSINGYPGELSLKKFSSSGAWLHLYCF